MKKYLFLLVITTIIICNAKSQITTLPQKNETLILSQSTEKPILNTRSLLTQKPGSFPESTPGIYAPLKSSGNTTSLSINTVGGALNDAADTKYYLFDCDKNGKDKLLAIKPNASSNGLRRLDRNSSNTIAQMGEFRFTTGINIYDEIYFGEFSPENGQTVLVNDKRSNSFWHYQHNASNYMIFERPYSMLSNWAVSDKYLTGDFNGDGKTDLLGWNFSRNEFQVALHTKNPYAGLGEASLQPAGVWLAGWAQTVDMNIVVGDFNGDRKDDIAVVHQPTGEWWVALSTGTSFQPSTGYKSGVWLKPWAVGTQNKIVAVDVNNDGKCDLVKYDYTEKSFQAVLSSGVYFDFFFKKEFVANAIANPEQIAIGKFDGNCIITVGHELLPDARFLYPRRAVSIYLTNYRR